MAVRWDLDRARDLDKGDPLGGVRREFLLPPGIVYLDGNSLGALRAGVGERLTRTLEAEWGTALAAGWGSCGWMELPERVGDRIAPIIGANAGEVLVADTTSLALTKLLVAALDARPARRVVVSTSDNFPSDLYVAGEAARRGGAELRVVDRDRLRDALDPNVAVCALTHVDFRTGELFDIAEVTEAAHDAGALVLWDLCHSAGAVPVGCGDHGVDLAVGCGYKYLNGGPGAPAFLYVRQSLHDELANPIPGWLGHDAPFAFDTGWLPATGIRKFLTSTPPVLALAALDSALDAFDGISIDDVRAKSLALGQVVIEMVEDAAIPTLTVATPREPGARGSQVSLRHPRAAAVVEAAAAQGVIGDLRPPDLCRFGFAPLYLSYEDVYRAAEIVVDVARSLEGPSQA